MQIFIPGNVPSSKNSKIKSKNGIFHSKTVTNYLRSLNIQSFSSSKKTVKGYVDTLRPNLFIKPFTDAGSTKPTQIIKIGFHFIRKDKRKFDYINMMQLPLDLMTAHDLIDDDNCDNIIPYVNYYNNSPYTINKDIPGVWLTIDLI